MPGFIDISIIGDDAGVQHVLLRMNSALEPTQMGGWLRGVVGPYIRGRASARFASEGDDVTGGWLPLALVTQQIRARDGYGPAHPINRRSGELENYIVSSPDDINVHSEGATLTYPGAAPSGELADKVRVAQQGSQWPSTPPRPVLGVNERDLEFVLGSLANHIAWGVATP